MGLALMLGGCGADGPTEYTKDTICGIPTSVVADVLGSRELEVGTDDRTTMPFDGSAPLDNLDGFDASTSCSVLSMDGRLLLSGEIVGPGDVEVLQRSIKQSYDTFDHAGGVGGVKGRTSSWGCGQVSVLVTTSGEVDPSSASLQAATEAFADVTGCWSDESP